MGIEIFNRLCRKKAEKAENKRRRAVEEVMKALEILKREIPFENAYIFGSAARPYHFRETSDIDIAFEELDEDMIFFVTGFLSNHLEQNVNVVQLEDVPFKEKIKKEGLRWTKS